MGAPFLRGVRVLDVTGALAGPYCTAALSDLGAEVIKIEPVGGDSMRRRMMGPDGKPVPFDLVHRNKASLAVDLKTAPGREIVHRLARVSDVFVENFRVGALRKLGLGYDHLRGDCPNLVYCSISGFGQSGPMRDAKGVDLIAQAYGGLLSVTGTADGQLAKAGFPVADAGSGMWATIGVLAALLRVRAGGGGAYLDVSLADTIAAWSLWEVADYTATGVAPAPLGTAHRLAAPYQGFSCSDGRTLVIGAVDRSWPALCAVLHLDLADDDRFATEYSRFVHREVLADLIQPRFATAAIDHWLAVLSDAGIPCGPVNDIAAIIKDPQFAERGIFLQDPERYGEPVIVNTPIIADGAPGARDRAPELGEDTASLLAELGYDPARIEQLAREGVVGVAADVTTTA